MGSEQVKYFSKEYQWIFFNGKNLDCNLCKTTNLTLLKSQGIHCAKEWINGEVSGTGDDIRKQQANLRKKICKHRNSKAHLHCEQIVEKSTYDVMPIEVMKLSDINTKTTEYIFRTAYYIAKNQRPYSDMPKLIDLQMKNSLNMGRILQSDKSCTSIINHITFEMKKIICNDIIEHERKICIIVNESTTISQKTMLVICLRTAIADNNITFFFDIMELSNTSVDSIKNTIISNLAMYGLIDIYLNNNLVAFVSDGASAMLGRKSGVGIQLKKMYPQIILWHCCNHRLELAVCDTVKEINAINNFQCFIEKLYSLYHQSPKNANELKMCAASLEQNLIKIGKIFTIRWIASSEKTLKAVWNNFETLSKHFSNSAVDNLRTSKERSKYSGLLKTLASVEFVSNLGE